MEGAVSVQTASLRKAYGDRSVLADVCAHFPAGQLSCIIGRSGSGKSTLLKCINGLEIPDSGTIQVGDFRVDHARKYSQVRRYVGMVFQDYNLFPHLTLLQNVAMPLVVVKQAKQSDALELALQELKRVQLDAHVDKYPGQLSGGQQQRGAIARALAMNPKVLLYDEPTSALDIELVDDVLQIVKELSQQSMTQIMVTHEMHFVRRVADRVFFIDQGQIVEEGEVDDVFDRPNHESTKQFLRRVIRT